MKDQSNLETIACQLVVVQNEIYLQNISLKWVHFVIRTLRSFVNPFLAFPVKTSNLTETIQSSKGTSSDNC